MSQIVEYEFFQNLNDDIKTLLVDILQSSFKKNEENPDFQLIFSMFKFLSTLVEFNDEEELIMFSTLSDSIYKTIEFILIDSKFDEDQTGAILDEIDIWLEYGGKLNYSKMQNYIDLFYKAIEHKNFDTGVKNRIRELTITVAYIAPSNIPQMPNALKQLLLICISSLCPENDKIDQQWLMPLVDDKLVEFETTQSLSYINRLMKMFECEIILPVLSGVVRDLLLENNWTTQYAAIMALSQVSFPTPSFLLRSWLF